MQDNFITEYIVPVRVIATGGNVYAAETLLNEKPLQIGLSEGELCAVQGVGFIVLDFGKEYHGGARILTANCDAGEIRLRFGESVSETYAELGEKGACNDHSPRDFKVCLPGLSDLTFGQTGFRFLRIDFLSGATFAIKNVYCAYTHRQFPASAPFKSSDERITEIFNTAKRTVELCCQTYLWDGIKRDRLVWIGDMHPEMLALTSLYGRCDIIERSLDFTVSQVPLGQWMNGIPMYSMWWLIILADYCAITGTYDYAAKHSEYVEGILRQVDGCVTEEGDLVFPFYFVDWPTHEQPDEMAGCRAIITIMAKKGVELCKRLGLDTSVAEYLLQKAGRQPMEIKTAKQVWALKYFALGKLDKAEVEGLTANGAYGMSTFMSYYILKAVAETASVETARAMMTEYYGAMLDKGATTFFEDFDMEWVEGTNRLDELPKEGQKDIHGDFGKYCYIGFRHSFCHGWSAGVIKFLYEYCNEL